MLLYEHITNISPKLSATIKTQTQQNGWDHRPLNKDPMMRGPVGGSWDITKDKDDEFHNIFLDDNMLIYRRHGTEGNEQKYHRMRVWQDDIRIDYLRKRPIDEIVSKIEEKSNSAKDKIYLANKLQREQISQDANERLGSYLDSIRH